MTQISSTPGAPSQKTTLPALFHQTVERHGAKDALLAKVEGRYQAINYREFKRLVDSASAHLLSMKVGVGDRVAILSENRPEWVITDHATLALAAVTVPIYPTLTPEQIAYILNDAGVRVIAVSNAEQLERISQIRSEVPSLEHVIVFDRDFMPPQGRKVQSWSAFIATGASLLEGCRDERLRRLEALRPDDLASIVYTSGTTGEPKGAMLTHWNFTSNAMTAAELMAIRSSDVQLSFLPLSHVLERVVSYAMQSKGVAIAFAESFDTIAQNMVEVRPTLLVAVPRVLSKVHARTMESLAKESFLKREAFYMALELGEYFHQVMDAEGRVAFPVSSLYQAADKLVFSKFREKLGGRLRLIVSGAAPLRNEVGQFFRSAGIPVIEGYGLTETSPVLTLNPVHRPKYGTVGQTIPGVTLMIAPDGEVLAKGPNVMRGYWNKEEATREAIDSEGWFHTGDIGTLDAEGYLRIIDRKKELLILSNGKNVAPQPIENALTGHSLVEQAVVIGEGRHYVSALLVPAWDVVERMAREVGLTWNDRRELLDELSIRERFDAAVSEVNAELAPFEQIKRYTLLPDDFTQESGELTPSLKLKRRVIATKFQKQIDGMYVGSETRSPVRV
ncbi:Long-chain-fatty-acid--CoA ligase FadD15 [compost metagenome]